MRNHTVIPRPTLINWIVETVPSNNKVELQNPQVFILVEVFKVRRGLWHTFARLYVAHLMNRASAAYP